MVGLIQRLNRLVVGLLAPGLGDIIAALWNQRHSGGGITVNADPTKFDIAAGKYSVDGIDVDGGAGAANALDATVDTAAGQFRKVAILVSQAGVYSILAGAVAASQGKALLPATPAGKCLIGWLEIPASFTHGATNVTGGMIQAAHSKASLIGQLT